jgi:hypothetical protein
MSEEGRRGRVVMRPLSTDSPAVVSSPGCALLLFLGGLDIYVYKGSLPQICFFFRLRKLY